MYIHAFFKEKHVCSMGKYPALGAFLCALVCGVILIQCSDENSTRDEPLYRDFYVLDATKQYTDPDAWYTVHTKKLASTNSAIVYVDEAEADVSVNDAQQLASEFDAVISPKVTQYFARPLDVDRNGKIVLVVFDIKDNYAFTGAYMGGYFYPYDLFKRDTDNPHSNEGDILYIDCNPQAVPADAKKTLAHEFQHLVNFSNAVRKYNATGAQAVCDTWIDEGLAEAAGHLCFGALTDRISYYNAASGIDQHPLFYWDDAGDVLNNYAKSYLFFQYMRAQSTADVSADAGWDIYKNILASDYGDWRAVAAAMQMDDMLSNSAWGSTDGERFNRLVLRWYAASNIETAGIDAKYSYKGVLGSNPLVGHLYTFTTVNLKSGGGVVKTMNGAFSSPSVDFIYLSVSGSGSSDDFNSPFADFDYFVAVYGAYNVDMVITGNTSLPASVAAIDPVSGESVYDGRGGMRAAVDTAPQRIDMVFSRKLHDSPPIFDAGMSGGGN